MTYNEAAEEALRKIGLTPMQMAVLIGVHGDLGNLIEQVKDSKAGKLVIPAHLEADMVKAYYITVARQIRAVQQRKKN